MEARTVTSLPIFFLPIIWGIIYQLSPSYFLLPCGQEIIKKKWQLYTCFPLDSIIRLVFDTRPRPVLGQVAMPSAPHAELRSTRALPSPRVLRSSGTRSFSINGHRLSKARASSRFAFGSHHWSNLEGDIRLSSPKLGEVSRSDGGVCNSHSVGKFVLKDNRYIAPFFSIFV